MFSAGRVLLMPKGAYNPLTTYEMLDIVSYNGSSYIAKGTTKGNLPTDTTYWQLSAYGGQAANIAGNFAELESSSVATATHYVDDIFVDENSQLMKATQTINIGDTIDANVNCAPTTVEALIAYLSSYVDSLDSLNKKIQGAIEIAAQTDLHSLAIGEYYKKQSTFYVTNGPTGIDQDPTAIFRLTVEAALDNASQASSPLLLTLRTPDGKIYTQSFDGTNWGSWVEVASAASVSALNTAKQPKTLDTPITVGGVQQTTVEGALGSINQTLTNKVANEIATRAKVSGHNLLPNYAQSQTIANSIQYTLNADGSITLNGTANANDGINFVTHYKGLPSGQLIFSKGTANDNAQIYLNLYNGNTFVRQETALIGVTEYAFNNNYSGYDSVDVGVFVENGKSLSNVTFYPMIRLATDESSDYEPYAMTNQELTPIAQAVSNRNLLDNPWFTVNQRGESTYTANNKYTVDRWKYEEGTATITKNSDGTITISSTTDTLFTQRVAPLDLPLEGEQITISLDVVNHSGTVNFMFQQGQTPWISALTQKISSNGIVSKTATIPADFYTNQSSINALRIQLKGTASITLRAVKLEKGAVSTLAMDTAPNYQQELAKCQRYFMRIGGTGGFGHGIAGYGLFASSARCVLWKGMNANLATLVGMSNLSDFKLIYDGKMVDVTNMSIAATDKDFVNILVDVAETDLQYKPCYLRFNAAYSYMDISADL